MSDSDCGSGLQFRLGDPRCAEASVLLREAAIEARQLYPELFDEDSPWPTNVALGDRGVFVLAFWGEDAVACSSLRPLDAQTAELRRFFVSSQARRQGVAKKMLEFLEDRARDHLYLRIRLETGFRQDPAMALYESMGYVRIPPFGEYKNDPTSVCFQKCLSGLNGS